MYKRQKQLVVEKPVKAVKPISLQPPVEKTFACRPLVASPALAPIPAPTVARIPRPRKTETSDTNMFVPSPSFRPLDTPSDPKVAVDTPRRPLPVEPASKSSQIVNRGKPVRQISHSSPELKQHVVQPGESFFTIAQHHYGDCLLYTSPSPRD